MNRLAYQGVSYFPEHLPSQVKELFLSVAILNFAASAVALFEPIYLYSLGWTIEEILVFFLGVYVIYFFVMPFGAKIARHKGYEHAIFYASFFLIGYFICLAFIGRGIVVVILAMLFLALQKMLYWPGYHADFARYGRSDERGREISNLIIINSIGAVAAPLIGGALITLGGYPSLFIFSSALILVSNFPLLSTKEVFIPKEFHYWDAYKRLVRMDYRRHFYTFLAFGEEVVLLIIWPIAMYLALTHAFTLGLVASAATFGSALIVLFAGKSSDQHYRKGVLRTGTAFYSLAGFLRVLAHGVSGFFLIDMMLRTAKNILAVPLLSMTYERAAHTSVMKSVVHFEMSIVVGKILSMLVCLALLYIFKGNFIPLFIFGGLLSWLYALGYEGYRPLQ